MPNVPRRTRRELLGGLTVFVASTGAGCGATLPSLSGDTATPSPVNYEYLKRVRVYLSPAVSLTLPAGVTRAATPAAADLVVLPATTPLDAPTAIDWLLSGKGIALVGAEAEATIQRWKDSNAYRDAFESRGRADAHPQPELVVTFARGHRFISKYSTSWGHSGEPTDSELLQALERALRVEAKRTPVG